MKFDRSFLLLLFFIVLTNGSVFSQIKQTFDPFTDEIKDKLPPLSILLDSAIANDPSIHFRNLQITVNNCKVKIAQTDWSRNLGLQANLGYGTIDYLNNSTIGGSTPSSYTTSQNLTQYGLGAYVRFPAADVVGRKNLIKLAKAETDQAEQMVEQQTRELRQKVIAQYNDVIVKQQLLKIRLKYLETSRISMQLAEKEFANGTISVTEFTRLTEIVTHSETDFEIVKMDFKTAYMLLEEMVGMKFNIY